MTTKRKDAKGKVLRDGESQRSDGRYQYRYTDSLGKRHTIYANDLKSLREREAEVQKLVQAGVAYAGGSITVAELVERYLSLKQGLRQTTLSNYMKMLKTISNDPFGQRMISSVKVSDAKRWAISLRDSGKKCSSIKCICGLVKRAYQMAYEEDIVAKNPFNFKVSDVVKNDTESRIALTPEQQKRWLEFIKGSSRYAKYYDIFVVLLGTGMRIGEFCGLTISDLDFQNRRIRVDHQMIYSISGEIHIDKPKTKAGTRFIPMMDTVQQSLQNILANRHVTVEPIIEGYSGFLILAYTGRPRSAGSYERIMAHIQKSYNALHEDAPLPHMTPHILRHTFCTNMANSGMDVKSLQYIMGHSNSAVTLDVYTHTSYDHAAEQMQNVVDFQQAKLRLAE